MPRIKLIIIDFYGVMTHGSYKDTCQWLAKRFGGNWKNIYGILYYKYFNAAAVGKIKESEFLKMAIDEFGYPLSDKKLLKIHLSFQKLNKKIFNLCLELQKQGYKILLLSKNTPLQFAAVLKMMKMRRYFKHIINTFDLGLAKDSPKTIRYILKKFKVKPREVIMIDDQDFNLPAAKKMGVNTILYKNFNQFKKELDYYLMAGKFTIPKGIKVSEKNLVKIFNVLAKKSLDLSTSKNLKFSGLKRLAVFRCYDKKLRKEVVVKLSPFEKKYQNLLLKEHISHHKLFNTWYKKVKIKIPEPYDYGKIKVSKNKNIVYTKMEYIKHDQKTYLKLVKKSQYQFLKEIQDVLHKINKNKLKKVKELPQVNYRDYLKEVKVCSKKLSKFIGLKTQKSLVRLFEDYSEKDFKKNCDYLSHGDFSDINILVNKRSIYLIDLEMAHLGHKFEDWARIILRSEIYNPKLKKKLVKTLTKSFSDIEEVKKLMREKPTKPRVKSEFYKDLKSDKEKKEFKLLLINRYLWYIERKLKQIKKPFYKVLILELSRQLKEIVKN